LDEGYRWKHHETIMADDLSIVSSQPLPDLSVVESKPLAEEPSLYQNAKKAASAVYSTLPTGIISDAAKKVSGYAQGKLDELQKTQGSPVKTGLYGAARDTASLVSGATSPQGVGTAIAGVVAPEIVGPLLIAHGVYSGVKGWGDLKNPDVLQNELGAVAEIAGGAAMTGGQVSVQKNSQGIAKINVKGGPAVQVMKAGSAADVPAKAMSDFQAAIPPSKSSPYTPKDYEVAKRYLDGEHAQSPIQSVTDVRDSANAAISNIEDGVSARLVQNPQARLAASPIGDVKQALQSNPRGQAFVNAGLKDLQDFNLDQPKTLVEADNIRRQLNYENKAVLKKNNYDVATARATDPGFAAREAAAESLRNGIYDQLPGTRDIRLDEGSLIKIRNAAENQIFNGDKVVRSTAQTGAGRQVGKALVKAGSTATGAMIGGPSGAIIGSGAGEAVGNLLTPEGLTKNELASRAFSAPAKIQGRPVQLLIPQKARAGSMAGLITSGGSADE
jgi:hypothetical protein